MKELYQVIYSPDALDDLRGIYSYIAYTLSALHTAEKQVNRIRKEIRSLDLFPERNATVEWEPWSSMGMRKFPVDNYIVFYLTDKEKHIVLIDRIVYGGQDIEHIIRDLD
ncbi:MAG: type II toxin-antitoxin system RelE/ParE family toxin [Acidaminococcaceae bacterium]|nr:type II toxin-antitoxin system RelE/ParE family toxin [Acidaminococcaceae bacterium]